MKCRALFYALFLEIFIETHMTYGQKVWLHMDCVAILKSLHGYEQSCRFQELRIKATLGLISCIEEQELALIYERAMIRHLLDD
jgi:hypothetical protein